MAHAALKSLPPEVLTKVDLALVKGKSCSVMAKALHADGYLKGVKLESLARELRKYRDSEIKQAEAARAVSISRSPNPAQQKKILDRAQDYDVIANWLKLIQRQEKRVDKWLSMGAGNMPSTAVLNDIKTLNEMFAKFNTACMDRGLLPRAATSISLRAEMVVVDDANVDVVIGALLRYIEQDREGVVHPFARELVQRAQVQQVVKNVKHLVQLPSAELEPTLIDATAVRVD